MIKSQAYVTNRESLLKFTPKWDLWSVKLTVTSVAKWLSLICLHLSNWIKTGHCLFDYSKFTLFWISYVLLFSVTAHHPVPLIMITILTSFCIQWSSITGESATVILIFAPSAPQLVPVNVVNMLFFILRFLL